MTVRTDDLRLYVISPIRPSMYQEDLAASMSIVNTAEITKGTSLMDDEYLKAAMLGWGIKLMTGHHRLHAKASSTGTGSPKQIAASNYSMLDIAIYHLSKKHYHRESDHSNTLELFWR
ncbi:hypothetical protein EDD18DRAFT_1105236 [Armillaria luteobubalina]|uniref:Uncharacterized protein n=1 Tax=Armillaria luteobubalina TaxID=153913 RepID=A0AA39UXC9_9AGAR|nr:hypothetical protein EDD18DRAFT_1105236 [Armillaria luteobubalina]